MVEAVSTLIASVATLFSVLLLWRRFFPDRSAKTVALVVLGDIGRSPRMMYHAKSFARHGWTTYIVSYKGNAPAIVPPSVRAVACRSTRKYGRLETAERARVSSARPLCARRPAVRVVERVWTCRLPRLLATARHTGRLVTAHRARLRIAVRADIHLCPGISFSF